MGMISIDDSILPPCPKCGGKKFIPPYTPAHFKPCPDCLDTPGKVSIGWLVAVFELLVELNSVSTVIDACQKWKIDTSPPLFSVIVDLLNHLRSVRAEVTE